MDELMILHQKILLKVAFGFDFADVLLDYEHEGKIEKKSVGWIAVTVFHECMNRLTSPHIILFPFLCDWYFTPYERTIVRNCKRLRNFLSTIVQERRAAVKAGKDSGSDLLGILLTDENFHSDNEMILDECLTFFFAGAGTSSMAH